MVIFCEIYGLGGEYCQNKTGLKILTISEYGINLHFKFFLSSFFLGGIETYYIQ